MKHLIDLCMYSIFVKQSIFMPFDSISQNVYVIEAVSTPFIGVVKVGSSLINALLGSYKEKNTYIIDLFAKRA